MAPSCSTQPFGEPGVAVDGLPADPGHAPRQPAERADQAHRFGQPRCLALEDLPGALRRLVLRGEPGAARRDDEAGEASVSSVRAAATAVALSSVTRCSTTSNPAAVSCSTSARPLASSRCRATPSLTVSTWPAARRRPPRGRYWSPSSHPSVCCDRGLLRASRPQTLRWPETLGWMAGEASGAEGLAGVGRAPLAKSDQRIAGLPSGCTVSNCRRPPRADGRDVGAEATRLGQDVRHDLHVVDLEPAVTERRPRPAHAHHRSSSTAGRSHARRNLVGRDSSA